MAEAIGKAHERRFFHGGLVRFDSAGTHAIVGAQTDPRTRAVLERNQFPLVKRRARRLRAEDFVSFDLILGMDQQTLSEIRRECPDEYLHKVRLFLDFAPGMEGMDIPDPYYGSPAGFDRVFELCVAGVKGLMRL